MWDSSVIVSLPHPPSSTAVSGEQTAWSKKTYGQWCQQPASKSQGHVYNPLNPNWALHRDHCTLIKSALPACTPLCMHVNSSHPHRTPAPTSLIRQFREKQKKWGYSANVQCLELNMSTLMLAVCVCVETETHTHTQSPWEKQCITLKWLITFFLSAWSMEVTESFLTCTNPSQLSLWVVAFAEE